ncbi:MAG: hypothetical protein ACRD4S_16815 [Candidatus Acidiferrales bacterium]
MIHTKKPVHENKTELVAAQVTLSVKSEIEKIALAEDRTVSQIVRYALTQFVESRRKTEAA